jgi:hypothetical protein
MGTRHLIGVVLKGELRVAQYGQWDGYLSGQGVTVLDFLKSADMDKFRKQVEKCYFVTDESEKAEIDSRFQKDYDKCFKVKDWSKAQKKFLKTKYGYLSRDTGAGILGVILRSKGKTIPLFDSADFARDGLFCEWGYLVNLDTSELEIYKGFSKNPVKVDERFAKVSDEPSKGVSGGYYPIQLLMRVKFAELPEELVDPTEVKEDSEEAEVQDSPSNTLAN